MTAKPHSVREASIWSEQIAKSSCPPETVLLRWAGELLLLDAWDPTGVSGALNLLLASGLSSPDANHVTPAFLQTRLRTPPSLINEAIAHFGLRQSVGELRLAVLERVDKAPSQLYLGISALRFIESATAWSDFIRRKQQCLTPRFLPNFTDGRVLELVDIRSKRRSSALHPASEASDNDHVVDLGELNAWSRSFRPATCPP